jgi:L-lactate permease
MGTHKTRRLIVVLLVGALICAECAYVIDKAIERGQWFPAIGGALITLLIAIVLAVAVIRS